MNSMFRMIAVSATLILAACQGYQSEGNFQLQNGAGWSGSEEVPNNLIPALSANATASQISATVTGDMIEYVDFYYEKELSPRRTVNQAPYTFTLSFDGLAAGAHELRVVAGIKMLGEVSTLTRYVPFTVPEKSAGPACNQRGQGQFFGCYYSGTNFDELKFTRMDQTIQFDFGTGGPGSGVAADNFSIKWQGDFDFSQAGTYRFRAKADDGIRVYVDGNRVIDEWRNQAATEFSADVTLTKGTHRIDVEYYEAFSLAEVSVSWAATSGGGSPATEPPPMSDGNYGARPVPRSKNPSSSDAFVAPNGSGSACTQASPCSLTTGLYGSKNFIWMASGTYNVTSQITLRNNKTLEALEPQRAIIDFGERNARLMVDNNTILRNVVVRRANNNSGIHIFGNYNLIEGVISERNYYSGISIWCGGYDNLTSPSGGSFNTIKDTIVRYNSENCAKEGGGTNCSDSDADGISISCGQGNRVTHVSALYNADDGIDVWRSYESTVENCLAMGSGRDPNDANRRVGNGNGYKMGGPLGTGNRHTFVNNWSYNNRVGDFSFNSGYGFTQVSGNVCGQDQAPCSPR